MSSDPTNPNPNPPLLASTAQNSVPTPPHEQREMVLFWVRMMATILVLLLAIGVTFFPNVTYAPAPRVILFMLVAMLPAILVGAEAATRFELRLPGVLITAGGTFAAVLIVFWLLNYYAKPEQQIAVFEVIDENSNPVSLDQLGRVQVKTGTQGISATHYVQGNTLVLIYPEQLAEVTVVVKKEFDGPEYRGDVGYAGNRTKILTLGQHLKKADTKK